MKKFFFPYDLKIKTNPYFHFYTLSVFLIVFFLFLFSSRFIELDNLINEKIELFHAPTKTKFFILVTQIFNSKIFIIWFLIFCLALFGLRKRTEVFFLGFSISFGVLIKTILKEIIQRPRPWNQMLESTSSSFPSGHSTVSALFFIGIYLCFSSQIKSPFLKNLFLGFCILGMLTIAFSRVYLHMHFLSDIVAGLTLGLTIIFTGRKILTFFTQKKN